MFTAGIIEDEKGARTALEKILERYFSKNIKLLFSVSSVKEAVSQIKELKPNIVFLDIEMPVENGFSLFDYVPEPDFYVVFTTAYKEYALDAFKFSALDYLLKPINHIELQDVIKRIEKKTEKNQFKFQLETLITNLNSEVRQAEKIALPTLTGYEFVKVNNIAYCQADNSYTIIFTNRNEKFIITRTLKVIEDLLPQTIFMRIHKTYLVNINYIKTFNKTGGHSITLENQITLPVAMDKSNTLIDRLKSIV